MLSWPMLLPVYKIGYSKKVFRIKVENVILPLYLLCHFKGWKGMHCVNCVGT